MNIDRKILKLTQKITKRMLDLILGSLMLFLFAPLLLTVAVFVKATSPGPILFKQYRVGVDGKKFSVYKFRTMHIHAEKEQIMQQAAKTDSRITPIGAFLRKTSLDEMPQLLNVLKGDMSLVGPRPQNPFYHEKFNAMYERFDDIKPGITGWAQINNWRGNTDTLSTLENNILYDEYYIENWTLLFDLKIILLTIHNGLVRGNAY
jgi:putative colanic acid biosynthesis UDP-glucose lipid carrier transferase